MGTLADFREVLKELKHKKRGEATTKLCPKCGSHNITISSCFGTYPQMFGITPRKYVCAECGYNGSIVMEQPKEETV